MTSLQIYGLAAPFVIAIMGGALAWWSHYQTLRSEREASQSDPAE